MKQKSIRKNYIMNTAYQMLTLITPLITAPYISRVFGAAGVGAYSYTNSMAAIFALFAALGTAVYGQRTVAQCRDNQYLLSKNFWEIELLSLLTTAVCIIFWLTFAFFQKAYRAYFFVLTLNIISAGFDISWFFSGQENFSALVLKNVIVKITIIVLLFTFVKDKSDLTLYIVFLWGGQLLGNLSMWPTALKNVEFIPFAQLKLKKHFHETLVYFVPTIAASVYTHIDKAMIGVITHDAAENGYYEQAQKLINMSYMLVASLNTVMSSRISYLFAKGKTKEIRGRLEKSLAFILTLSIPITFGICGVAENFVPWFFGSGYDRVVLLLILYSPLVVILSIHNFLSSQYLLPSGQRARSTKGVLAGAGVNFVCNLLLIPKLGAVGATVATIIAESTICAIYFHMSKAYIPFKLIYKYLPKRLLSASVMLFGILIIGKSQQGDFWVTIGQVGMGIAVYFLFLILVRDKFLCLILKGYMSVIIKKLGKNKKDDV